MTDHAELARLAEAIGSVEWHAGHLCRDDHPCDCADVFDGVHAGAIATVHVSNGLPISDGGNDAPEPELAKLHQAFIAAANPARVLALLAEVAALRVDLAKTERDYSELRDSYDAVVAKLTIERAHGTKQSIRATQAERQRDEAVGHIGLIVGDAFGCNEDSCLVSHRMISEARTFLASMEPKT